MNALRCVQVTTKRELDDALAVRWKVFGQELGLAGGGRARRELDEWDTLETTLHWVVYAGRTPVGTVRLLLPPQPGAAADPCLGLPFGGAFRFDDRSRAPRGGLAQAGRICVEPGWRRSRALSLLFGGMWAESMERRVAYWLAPVNCSTDHPVDAEIVHRLTLARGLGSERFRASPRAPAEEPHPLRWPLYDLEQRRLAGSGAAQGLPLPGPVQLCASKLRARCIGPPAMDASFGMFALPMVVDVRSIPAGTVRFAPLVERTMTEGDAA